MHAHAHEQGNDDGADGRGGAGRARQGYLHEEGDDGGAGDQEEAHVAQGLGHGMAEVLVAARVAHDEGEGHDRADAEDHVASEHAFRHAGEDGHGIHGREAHAQARDDKDQARLVAHDHADDGQDKHEQAEVD